MRRVVLRSQLPAPGLEEVDAILSEDAEVRLKRFIKNENQDLLNAGERFSESYRGIPDCIRTLLLWMSDLIDDDFSLLHQATEGALENLEARFVTLMNGKLSRSDSSLPEITTICTSTQWNAFFTGMTKRHPNSLLRNALKREKKLAEVAIHKASLADPNAFSDEFSKMLISVVGDHRLDEDVVHEETFKRLSALCVYDENVTQTALYLLAKLSRQAHNELSRLFYRRVSQHVRQEAVAVIVDVQRISSENSILRGTGRLSQRDATRHVCRLMMMADCSAVDVPFRFDLVDAVLIVCMSTLDVGDFRTAEPIDVQVNMVTIAYSVLIGFIAFPGVMIDDKNVSPELDVDGVHEKAVFIRMLCYNEVLDNLFNAAFNTERRPSPVDNLNASKKRCLCILLSFAMTFIEREEHEIVAQLESETECRKLRTLVSQLFQKIELVVTTCETLKPGTPKYCLKDEALNTLLSASRDRFIARGILIWATDCLKGRSGDRHLKVTATAHLAFLAMLAEKHLALRPAVVDAIGQAMVRKYPDLVYTEVAEMQSIFMTCLLSLIGYNMGDLIADAFVKYIADDTSVDLSHLRRFVFETLRCVRPPFSKPFVKCMEALIAHPRLESVVKDAQMARMITNFRRGVQDGGTILIS